MGEQLVPMFEELQKLPRQLVCREQGRGGRERGCKLDSIGSTCLHPSHTLRNVWCFLVALRLKSTYQVRKALVGHDQLHLPFKASFPAGLISICPVLRPHCFVIRISLYLCSRCFWPTYCSHFSSLLVKPSLMSLKTSLLPEMKVNGFSLCGLMILHHSYCNCPILIVSGCVHVWLPHYLVGT